MVASPLNAVREAEILQWMEGKSVTYDDVARFVDRNYYTARDYIQELIRKGYVREVGFGRTTKKEFVLDTSSDTKAPLQFAMDKNLWTYSQLMKGCVSPNAPYAHPVGWAMAQLLLRSQYPMQANLPTEQYVQAAQAGGEFTNDQIKARLIHYRGRLKSLMDVLDSMLINRVVWEDGPELAQRCGGTDFSPDELKAYANKWHEIISRPVKQPN